MNIHNFSNSNDYCNSTVPGCYNGGAYSRVARVQFQSSSRYNYRNGSGGGVTSISLVSGLLSDLSSYKGVLSENRLYYVSNEILIVAGGGGGSDQSTYYKGYNGGGYKAKSATQTGTNFGASVACSSSSDLVEEEDFLQESRVLQVKVVQVI